MTNYCHLSYEERKTIEDELNTNKSINRISKDLNRSHSTILREIDRNKVYYEPKNWNTYAKFENPDYDKTCKKLNKSPHVCNGCKSRQGCRKERFTYYARKADDSYRHLISDSRKGLNLDDEQIYNINKVVKPLIKNGQTINHLYINHPEVLNFSKVSFYNYINAGVFDFAPIDLPRMVRYKIRKSNKRRTRQEREILIGRKYEDFLDYIAKNPDLNICEMDTVEGTESDSKCMLTLLWRKSNFMLIFLLESQTTDEVTKIFKYLRDVIPDETYRKLFQAILTDNGHEFYDVLNIECVSITGELITKVFYCDPSASWQKGALEKNHEFIRYVLPKKSTFENLTQNDCDVLANHINSLCRDSLNSKSPFEAMLFLCDEEVLHSLNKYYIVPDKVILKPKLLK